jgi:flagellar biosynthesis anti-sigma factor FlgM
MRIDGALPLPENLQTPKAANAGAPTSQSSPASVESGQDQTKLSGDSGAAQQLKTMLSQVPEVRQDRVDALRQALGNGSYKVSDHQLADAIGSALRIFE